MTLHHQQHWFLIIWGKHKPFVHLMKAINHLLDKKYTEVYMHNIFHSISGGSWVT